MALTLLVSPVAADPLILSAQSIELDPLHPERRTIGPLEFLAGYELSSESEYWGGLSGMVVSADGKLLTAVADTGRWYRIGMEHDSAGRLTGFMGAE
ncbi:MAG TPA: hypothetical protein VFZ07_10320, partial [Dongiaceae bacterium]